MIVSEDNYLSVLTTLASQVTSGVILEIGSKIGDSAIMLSVASVPVYCIDMWDLTFVGDDRDSINYSDPHTFETFLRRTKGLDVTHIKGISGEIAKVWEKPISLLFIDGDHRYSSCESDYDNYSKHIIGGGFLVIHDCLPGTDVESVCVKIISTGNWDCVVEGTTFIGRRVKL